MSNETFAENSWYFRNALVRANYNDLQNGIHATTKFLEMFFENLLLNAGHELKNRYMHIDFENECVACKYKTFHLERGMGMALENKLNITDSTELARMEEKISKKRAVELFENEYLDKYEAGTFEMLAAIHEYLFGEIYDFAGKIRTVNLAKGNFRFAPVMYLRAAIENIEKMPQATFDEIVEKYVEMNIAHPFREGNGRSTRIWLDLILKKELNKVIDWSAVDKEDYLLAVERSPIKDIEIKYILRQALTDQVDDRDVYMKGIDHSYYYEGYVIYKAKEL